MIIKATNNTCFVFDLDDTLYKEIDFLKSAFEFIAKDLDPDLSQNLFDEMLNTYDTGGNAFQYLVGRFPDKNLSVDKLLETYRNHIPLISLREGVMQMLINIKEKKARTGIITNGRKITQHNKIRALGIDNLIDDIIISEEFGFEKPDPAAYRYFQKDDSQGQYYFFGDNLKIDFIAPKKMNWCCIGILDDSRIHKTDLSLFSQEYIPHLFIRKFTEIEII
jgi:putative hydrolase of the HAD superfamily